MKEPSQNCSLKKEDVKLIFYEIYELNMCKNLGFLLYPLCEEESLLNS